MVAIRYSARTYAAQLTPSGKIIVRAHGQVAIMDDELRAYLWLGNHGLRRGRIKGLLAAALRNEGVFADPEHPKRVKL